MRFYDWWFAGWRIYDDWVETKHFNFNIRFVWYPSDILLIGVSFFPHTYQIHLLGFALHFHWLKKKETTMSSRERRLLDKDIEIRKLQSELKHYKTQFFVAVVEKDNIQKALDIAVDMLTRIAVSPETMMEPEKVVPQLADLALKQITALEQKE